MKNISKLIVSIASVLIGMLKQRMILRVYKMELREESLIKINIFG